MMMQHFRTVKSSASSHAMRHMQEQLATTGTKPLALCLSQESCAHHISIEGRFSHSEVNLGDQARETHLLKWLHELCQAGPGRFATTMHAKKAV